LPSQYLQFQPERSGRRGRWFKSSRPDLTEVIEIKGITSICGVIPFFIS
jgi:hypothetical protein